MQQTDKAANQSWWACWENQMESESGAHAKWLHYRCEEPPVPSRHPHERQNVATQ